MKMISVCHGRLPKYDHLVNNKGICSGCGRESLFYSEGRVSFCCSAPVDEGRTYPGDDIGYCSKCGMGTSYESVR